MTLFWCYRLFFYPFCHIDIFFMQFFLIKFVLIIKSVIFVKLGSVPKSVSGKNPLKSVNFKCHCKFNVLFLIVL